MCVCGGGGGGVSGNLWQIKPRDKTAAFSIVFINYSVVLMLLLQMTFNVQRALNIKNQSIYCLKGSRTDDAYIASPVDKNGITNKHTAVFHPISFSRLLKIDISSPRKH